ncbi:hypothetical protein BU16DRAFT_556912 [Lophium mytilinum]|uniref:Uncharacterized protein n=1 Tax=Lophium mytilinum TaxID=390894 RepID=A0A6A6R7T5_9PEZI|nr:hypothetical protein BU16DRAFT_556912 [Lophium mytilinum]
MGVRNLVARTLRVARQPKETLHPQHDRDRPRHDREPEQDVCVGKINPVKLVEKLQSAFGPGSFEVHMMHNVYCIRAPRDLLPDELSECQ